LSIVGSPLPASAQPSQSSAARFVHGALGQVLEPKARQEVSEQPGRVEAWRGEIIVSLGGDL
jgi:hypothetical protein